MTISTIDAQDLRNMLDSASRRIEAEETRLSELDSAIGDGDHGITMRIGFQAVRRAVDALPPDAPLSKVLDEAGKAFMNATGGAIGVILGRGLMAGGKALIGVTRMGTTELKSLLDSMEAGVVKVGNAQPGDKTMLDSLHAACEALATSSSNEDMVSALARAADAADAGALSTANMLCHVGRASRLGERVLGHPDPGAVSFSLILRSMSDWVRAKDARQPADV